MTVAERIYQHVQELPSSFQAEVLDFVEYLLLKTKRKAAYQQEGITWSDLSLSMAMRGMEDEDTPDYSIADLKEVFS
ncbi:MAG: hypothetical protein DRP11_04435 [Candidatus Aenigmatarchaeota archaeon]|nr:MAG: hypothetical protein DRP11_04435 [Candidatus Aenigmarchaeota archaeon]